MGMYEIGVILALFLALFGMYIKRGTIFKDHSDLSLAIVIIIVSVSSWLFVGHVLFKTIDRMSARG